MITVTVELVETQNYTFRRDGRAFYNHCKSLTARQAITGEIEKMVAETEEAIDGQSS